MTDPPHESMSFLEQLKRRRVIRVGIAYGAAAFVLLQVADLVFPAFAIPEQVYRVLVIVGLAGFPLALILSWLFDVTPQGIRLATTSGEAGRVVVPFRPLVVYGGLGLGALATIVLVAIWARPRAVEARVAPGADVIAVLPFIARGAGVEVMGEGMVYLLSRNLDEVGAIRTVDPRTVLHRWNEQLADSLVTAGEAGELTAEVGAGSYLWGQVIEGGGQVQITGDLWTVDGSRLAGADVTGPAEDVLALVDSFSVAVLREIWRSQGPLPRFNVAAITTGDPEAIRAYLRGESFYRASRWDSAIAAFSRAVEVDSTFALAYYRLARSGLWTGSPGRDEMVRAATEKAYHYADRLPARERTLVLAAMLQQSGHGDEAHDTLVAYLARYPDDPEVWFAVVDDEYHDLQEADPFREADVSIEEWLRPFDRVLDLDPNFLPGLIHPLEVSIREGDDARLERYLSMLEAAAPEDTPAVATYRTAARALSSPDDLDALRAALALAMRSDAGSLDMAWQARMAVGGLLTRAVITLPAESQERLLPDLERELAAAGSGSRVMHLMLRLLAASGRLGALRDALASNRPPIAAPWQRRYSELPVEIGHVDADYLERRTPPFDEGVILRARMISAVDHADSAAIRETAERARDYGRRVRSPTWDRLAAVGEGFARAAAGDPRAGLRDVEQALEHMDYQFQPFWFRLFQWMTRYPETRARGLAVLSQPWIAEPAYEVPRLYVLARTLEAEGDADGARRAYGRFVAILEDADPNLPVHARIDSARAALARLE